MRRLDVHGMLLDFRQFLRKVRLKLLFILIMAVLGIVLGIITAFSRGGIVGDRILRNSVFMVATGRRSGWGYFFFRFLFLTAVLIVITLLAMRPRLAWLAMVVVFLVTYSRVYFVAASFLFKGLLILPLMIAGIIIPFFLLLLVYCFYSVFLIDSARFLKVCCRNDLAYFFKFTIKPFLKAFLIIFIITIIETLLVVFLS